MSVYQSAPTPESSAIIAKDFDFWYGDFHALTGLDVNIARNKITAFIGRGNARERLDVARR